MNILSSSRSLAGLFTPNSVAKAVVCLLAGGSVLLAQAQAQTQAEQPRQAGETRLSETVVTATGFEQAVADAPASITVVTKEDLEGRRYRDVTDALLDIPGVSIEGGAGGKIESTQIYIRGLGEDYTLFLVDGKPLGSSSQAYYNGFGGAQQTSWLPPVSAIERIEVIRGPMSSLYGSSALGGVINIITKKVATTWTGSVTVDGVVQENSDAGSENQQRFYLSGPIVHERLGLTLYGSRFKRNEDSFTGGYAARENKDITAKLAWKLTNAQTLGLEATYGEGDNRRTARTGAEGSVENERNYYALTHEIDWGERMRTNSFITRESVDITNGSNQSKYQATYLQTKTVMPLDRHMISFGAEYKNERTDHDASRFPGSRNTNLERWQMALFAEDEFFLTDQFSVVGGIRYDRNEHYGSEWIPRLYGVYRLNEALTFKGGVSGGYKAPTLKQADDNIVEIAARGAAWDMGNKDLKPEKSTNYEIGLNWAPAQDVNASLTAYKTDFKDKISTQTICTSPANAPDCHYNGEVRSRINQYVNLSSATIKGLEAAYSMPLAVPMGRAKLNATYTYTYSDVSSGPNAGKPLSNLPRNMFNLGADWNATGRLKLWGKARYKGKSIDGGTAQLPAYTLVDVGATYQATQHVQLFGGLYNLLDKSVNLSDYGKTLDGRRLYLGLTAQF
ncbi:TonB-dependent receptor domain-containing protein [Comamonas composti]|uniref:TonB-dependent receptor domain-containing protein n=1 Tax=Comamonas composti TaxID=408558 RepID=UPI00040B3517|nr:TonB-dependent receptor [Comamonas composti]